MPAFVRYVVIESVISASASAVVSGLIYFLLFETGQPVNVGGAGGYAFDFVPQAFMTALLCTWLPGTIARKRRKAGHVVLIQRRADARYSLVRGGLGIALIAGASAGGAAVAIFYLSGTERVDWTAGLLIKLVFAAILGLIVTPYGLRKIFPAP